MFITLETYTSTDDDPNFIAIAINKIVSIGVGKIKKDSDDLYTMIYMDNGVNIALRDDFSDVLDQIAIAIDYDTEN